MDAKLLYELYTGKSRSLPDSLTIQRPGDKALKLAEAYRDLQSKYSPAELESENRVPEQLLAEMKEAGLFGITIPKAYGGLGFSLTDYLYVVSVMAETDMSLAIIPLAHLSIGVKGILLFGSEAQKKKYLPPAVDGSMIFAYALTEPKIGSDAKHIETTAVLSEDGTHYALNGMKAYITNGGYAGAFTLFAQIRPFGKEKTQDEKPKIGAFIVEAGSEGIEIGSDMPKMGLHISSTTTVRCKNVKVPEGNLLGEPGEGFKIAMTILNYGRIGLGAASAGVVRKSIVDMSSKASSRQQFGRPIAEFQLIKEMIGRAKIEEQQIWAITALTAGMLEEEPLSEAAIESSHAKLYGTTRAWDVLYNALQVAGGSGYLSTQPYEKRMRDFRVTTVFEGTTEIHSIYPPLAAMRDLNKEMEDKPQIVKFIRLQILKLKSTKAVLPDGHGLKRRTASKIRCELRKGVRYIRKNIVYGMIRYGKKAAEQEFFLRRITRMSISVFAIIALVYLHRDTEDNYTKKVIEETVRYTLFQSAENRKRIRQQTGREYATLHAANINK